MNNNKNLLELKKRFKGTYFLSIKDKLITIQWMDRKGFLNSINGYTYKQILKKMDNLKLINVYGYNYNELLKGGINGQVKD